MEKHWSHYCAMSMVHFMAFPETAGGPGETSELIIANAGRAWAGV